MDGWMDGWMDLDYVYSVAFSDDTIWIASGSVDKSVRLWCIEDSSKNQILQGHTGMYVRTYVFQGLNKGERNTGLCEIS